MMDEYKSIIIIDDDGFLGKYVERELRDNPLSEKQTVVLIKSDEQVCDSECDVCVLLSGRVEATLRMDKLITLCDSDVEAYTRFRLSYVVGTGMGGVLMDMARRIHRGTYYHISGSEARMSVVHAVDVARAIRFAIIGDYKGEYLLTDGFNPLRRDVAEGIANRLGQKRIPSISLKKYKRLAWWGDLLVVLPFSSREFSRLTTDDIVQGLSFAEVDPDWKPADTVNYLNTHDYGDDDF